MIPRQLVLGCAWLSLLPDPSVLAHRGAFVGGLRHAHKRQTRPEGSWTGQRATVARLPVRTRVRQTGYSHRPALATVARLCD